MDGDVTVSVVGVGCCGDTNIGGVEEEDVDVDFVVFDREGVAAEIVEQNGVQ